MEGIVFAKKTMDKPWIPDYPGQRSLPSEKRLERLFLKIFDLNSKPGFPFKRHGGLNSLQPQ
jgi:hypothetical protein